MTKEELSQAITKSIEELGFARIKRAALVDVFASSTDVSFNIHDELKNFAESRGLEFKDEDADFVVFRKAGTQASEIPS